MGFIITSLSLGLHFDSVILIGMFLAFLLNAFFYLSNIIRNTSLVLTSFVMAASYYTSNHFIDLSASTTYIYLNWIAYDLITIAFIIFLNLLTKQTLCLAAKYVVVGLCANAFLCLLIHIDLRILETREPWWFWYIYTLGINTIDAIMVAALILDRDFLCIAKIRGWFSKDSVKCST